MLRDSIDHLQVKENQFDSCFALSANLALGVPVYRSVHHMLVHLGKLELKAQHVNLRYMKFILERGVTIPRD